MRYLRYRRFAQPIIIILLLMIMPLTALAQSLRDPAVAATNPEYKGKGVQLPPEMLKWPMLPAPVPTAAKASTANPGEVIEYNVATGQERVLAPAGQPIQASAATSPFEGLAYPGKIPETVLGYDDRVVVTDTTAYPWRTIVKVFITFPDNSQFIGSGATIGRSDNNSFHVLTMGHVVYDSAHGGWAKSIQVVPGLDGTYVPYGWGWATTMRTYTAWVNSADWNYDFGLITLDRTLGNVVGWMGRKTAAYTDAIYTSILNTAGYPGDLSGGLRMYFDSDNGRTANEYRHWYYMDTAGGQSGSPVWQYTGTDRYILTVHGYGDDGSGSNSGTRLNSTKFNDLITWMNNDTLPGPTIDVYSPGTGVTWAAGSTQTVGWYWTGAINYVEIWLYNATTGGWTNLASNIVNAGSKSITVPNTSGNNFFIYVAKQGDYSIHGWSPGAITITQAKSITVTAPLAGATWTVGSTQTVSWTYTGSISTVDIWLWNNGAYTQLAAGVSNTGSKSVTVPNSPGTNCWILVIETGSSVYGWNPGAFSIVNPKSIHVLNPAAGATWTVGSTQTVTWTSTGISSVEIWLWNNGAWSQLASNVSSGASGGSKSLTVPNSPGTNCWIYVSEQGNYSVYDWNPGPFTIVAGKSIHVTGPPAGATWSVGSTQAVTWTYTGAINYVEIWLWNNGAWTQLASNAAANNGGANVIVPNSPGTNCWIYVSEQGNYSVYGWNPGAFTIVTGKSIHVTGPAAGSLWPIGTDRWVMWTYTGAISYVEIWLWNNGSWLQLASNAPASTGSALVHVPNWPGTNCWIYVSEQANYSVYGWNPGAFTIY